MSLLKLLKHRTYSVLFQVTCQTCGHESVRFDAFNLLSLPLPMESFILCEVLGLLDR